MLLTFVPSREDPCYSILNGRVPTHVYTSQEAALALIQKSGIMPDYIFALWFGPIFRRELLELPVYGVICLHPAYLPYTRGAHFNIWPLVEEVPFGVSIFRVNSIDNGIDTGEIVARRRIPYDWTDTGQTLREKAKREIATLFQDAYPSIRDGSVKPVQQDLRVGSTHYKKELDEASHIDLDTPLPPRKLLNWLRARTFPGYPACWFCDNGVKYEVRVSITKMEDKQ